MKSSWFRRKAWKYDPEKAPESKGKEINIFKKKKKSHDFWSLTHYFACLGLDILKVKNPKKEFPLQEMYLTLDRYITTASGWYVDHNLTKWMGDRLQLCIEKLLLRNLLFMGHGLFFSLLWRKMIEILILEKLSWVTGILRCLMHPNLELEMSVLEWLNIWWQKIQIWLCIYMKYYWWLPYERLKFLGVCRSLQLYHLLCTALQVIFST